MKAQWGGEQSLNCSPRLEAGSTPCSTWLLILICKMDQSHLPHIVAGKIRQRVRFTALGMASTLLYNAAAFLVLGFCPQICQEGKDPPQSPHPAGIGNSKGIQPHSGQAGGDWTTAVSRRTVP
jgi:hypothetical protein